MWVNGWYYCQMIFASSDLGLQIDYGPDEPGLILQCYEKGAWRDYKADGCLVFGPFEVELLQPDWYWLRMHRSK